MQALLKDEAASFFDSQEIAPPVSLRKHPLKGTSLTLPIAESIPWCSEGVYLSSRPSFTLDPLFHAGSYYVQEAGSMLIEKLISPFITAHKNVKMLDLCAAPGGKSTHLLSLLQGDGIVVSNELIPLRNKILRQNIAKWGYSNSIVTQNKAEDFARSGVQFDLILVDAPCSGEGLFRKDEQAILEWSADQVNVCSARQHKILDEILPALKPGGLLLYSTCTYESSENDLQMQRLIDEDGMQVCTGTPPAGISPTTYGWQAFPHNVKSEGFYCCLLRKPGTLEIDHHTSSKVTLKKKENPEVSKWLEEEHPFSFMQQQDFMYANTPIIHAITTQLSASCYIRSSGILMGEIKGKDFIPSAELALSNHLSKNLPGVDLNLEEAIHYLCGEPLKNQSDHLGWHLVRYNGRALGWAKKIAARWNNYYPKEWRIQHKRSS